MFLLVLLADVARAGVAEPAQASGGFIRSVATRVRPDDGRVDVILARGNGRHGGIRLSSQDRALANEIVSNYRAALRLSRASQAGPLRSLFDELCVESGSTVATLRGVDASSPFDPRLTAETPARPVTEHSGNPAP